MASAAIIQCKKCRALLPNKMDLAKHLMNSPGCKVASHFQCSTCRAVFPTKQDLKSHLYSNLHCKTIPKSHNPHAFTSELNGGQTEASPKFQSTVSHQGFSRPSAPDRSLLTTMEDELKKPKKSGLESSVLSAVAEGDEELARAYSRLTVNPVTGRKQLSKELVQVATRKAKIDVEQIASSISRAQIVSICFLLDTTGSMGSYISGVKEQIVEIINHVQGSGCCIAGLAFIGYKDWCDGVNHFEVLQFTKDISSFKTFLSSIRATGGGDAPEDVIGGMDQAVSLTWPEKSGSRILFHLGDAPPHGKERYHGSHQDDYPNGHPRDKPLEELFKEIHQKKLNYFFGRINAECDKMVRVFEMYYGGKIDSLDSSKASLICSSVTASVMSTISATCSTLSAFAGNISGKMFRSYMLDEEEPSDWSTIPQLQGTIMTFALPRSVEDITSFAKLEEKVKPCFLQIAPDPFAMGSVRLAYYGKLLYTTKENPEMSLQTDVVFKEMISLPAVAALDRQRYATNLEIQTIASKIAFEFNDRLSRTTRDPNLKIKYLMAKVVRITMEGGVQRFVAYEKRFHGPTPEMVKFTNNLDFVINPETLDADGRTRLELALAFSHFSYDFTGGYLLVCDIQGISTSDGKGEPILLLTDPAIHCSKHLRFGKTNLGAVGVNKFFKKHVCNNFCSALGLNMP